MITIKLEEKESYIACDISELEVELDYEHEQVLVYKNGSLLGSLSAICGMNEDDFVKQVKLRAVDIIS